MIISCRNAVFSLTLPTPFFCGYALFGLTPYITFFISGIRPRFPLRTFPNELLLMRISDGNMLKRTTGIILKG